MEFTFLLFKQKRNCTQSLSELLWSEEARISHQSNFLTWTVTSLCLYLQGGESKARDPTPAQHQGRRRSVRWTECVTFPLGHKCACQTSFVT